MGHTETSMCLCVSIKKAQITLNHREITESEMRRHSPDEPLKTPRLSKAKSEGMFYLEKIKENNNKRHGHALDMY